MKWPQVFKRAPQMVGKLHAAHPVAHVVYLGTVAVEAGKWYSVAAAVLLVISLAELVSRTGAED